MQSLIVISYLAVLTWERPEIVYGGDAWEGDRYCEATTTPLDSSSSMYYDVTFSSSPAHSNHVGRQSFSGSDTSAVGSNRRNSRRLPFILIWSLQV